MANSAKRDREKLGDMIVMGMGRKPVGISFDAHPMSGVIIVVCDDGSVWEKIHDQWKEQSPIPGSDRDLGAQPVPYPPGRED